MSTLTASGISAIHALLAERRPVLRLPPDDLARLDRIRCSHDEINAFLVSYIRFVDELQVPDDQANDVTEALMLRDRDGDDRRHCFECKHVRIAGCARRETTYTAARLQRCAAFVDAVRGGSK